MIACALPAHLHDIARGPQEARAGTSKSRPRCNAATRSGLPWQAAHHYSAAFMVSEASPIETAAQGASMRVLIVKDDKVVADGMNR